MQFQAYLPTRIVVGVDEVDSLGHYCSGFGKRALLVTGRSSMRKAGYTDRVIASLRDEAIQATVFDGVESNPERTVMNAAVKVARDARIDFVVGLGGGSALDTAKGVAAAVRGTGDVWDYVNGATVPSDALPIVAIPSTAGTGSEVTPYTVISNEESRRKNGFMSDRIIPRVAIIDPKLMSTVPAGLTAKAGGDALAQAVEAYTTKLAHPYSDLLSLEAIRLCERYLRRAVANGNDLEARAGVGWASALAGMAIAFVDVVIGHHASEAVGALFGTHHGETAAILLVPTLEFNFSETKDRLAAIARAMGKSTEELDQDAAAHAAIAAVGSLLNEIGISDRLSTIGVTADAIPEMIEILNERMEDLDAGNPRKITEETLREFFQRAI